MKPLFYTLLVTQVLLPAGMMPTIAAQHQTVDNSTRKVVFFLGSALLSFIGMISFGSAIQHTDISINAILLTMSLVPFPVTLIIEILVLGEKNLFLLDPQAHTVIGSSLTYFILSIVLILVP
jgi:EamA domain-containing membrane protein RarD